jgi:transcriptional regulator with XRE-family HTH domain
MSDKRNILGPRIKYLRKKAGLTQEELAAQLQVNGFIIDRPMISKIENQTRELLDYEVLAIANILRVDIKELFISAKDK